MPRFHYAYVIVVCCCLIMGVNVGLVLSCAGIFYQPVCDDLGFSTGDFGLYMSFNYVAAMVTLFFAGRLIERYSARWILASTSALLGLALLLMACATQLWHFYLAGTLIGVSMAFQMYLSFPTLINRWFSTRVGFFMGLCSAASGIGGVLFNPIGGWLISSYGWQTGYAVFGLVILVVVSPLLALLLRDRPEQKGLQPCGSAEAASPSSPSPSASFGTTYHDAIRSPLFYALFLFALLIMAVSTLNLFIPKYVGTLSYSLAQASLAASAVMAGVTIGKIALGAINDRSATAGVLTTTIGGMAGLALLIGSHLGFWAILGGAFLFGWAYAGVTVQTPLLVRTVFGNLDYARIYASISIAISIGGALSSGAWGIVAESTSYPFILTIGIVFLALCAIIGCIALRQRAQK